MTPGEILQTDATNNATDSSKAVDGNTSTIWDTTGSSTNDIGFVYF